MIAANRFAVRGMYAAMRFLAIGALSIGCSASARTATVDPFVGDWKLDPSRSRATDVMNVRAVDGDRYAFDLGGGGETITVDGTDQPGVQGTTLSVAVDGPGWKVVRKQAGTTLLTARWRLSADGNTLSDDYTELAPDGQITLHASYQYARTAGESGFAGTWERPFETDKLPSALLQIRPNDAHGLSFVRPSQQVTRTVNFDGKDYPLVGHGAPEGWTSSARRVDDHTLELTDKSKGQVRKTDHIELSPDRKTMTQTSRPAGQHVPNVFVYDRQPATGS
jgi:hypothetical protein